MSWRSSRVVSDGTHHARGNVPLYKKRFDEVLPFHEPGLAPVRCGDEAWHIRPDGSKAYTNRFCRTFGFYEGLAAVIRTDGWCHIAPDATALYTARYDWCGNFQSGRCAVRDRDGTYFHLRADGAPAYASRWRYAGDFRGGIGVIQADDGCSTHIDLDGNLIHGCWFLDLDIFHKGYARARNDDGWVHVDISGQPIHTRRFATIEPFYNGQARVERFDGGLEIIDESGRTVAELRPALKTEFASLSDDLVGFWRTQTICTAVELGLFEAMPNAASAIAEVCDLDPARIRRMLQALAELQLIRCIGEKWILTQRGEYLQASHPLTLADAALEYGRYFTQMWSALPDVIRANSAWRVPDIFGEVAGDAKRMDGHHRMLKSYALHDYERIPATLGLRGDERVVDAGGGLGVLADLLLKRFPQLHIKVLERPEVVEQAMRERRRGQIEFRSVDLFQPWGVEADVVLMARVLHDWDDQKVLELLRHARGALRLGGRIFVIEMLLPDESVAGSLCDLHLLMVTGGAERKSNAYKNLLDQAGFDLKSIYRIPALPSIIEGVVR